MDDYKTRPKKRHHKAKRIFERLQAEHGFDGGYTIVKDYIQEVRQHTREVFVPLHQAPGHAQADFGEALAIIDGVEQKVHFLVIDLPHGDAVFVKAYPRENSVTFCDGHFAAFEFFGGVPQSILYDNTKIAVACILGNGERQRTQVFSALQSHYLFKVRFGRSVGQNPKVSCARSTKHPCRHTSLATCKSWHCSYHADDKVQAPEHRPQPISISSLSVFR